MDHVGHAPVIELRGIAKSYPGVRALRGIDLDVFPGEVHAIVGENGAGKSTLVKILAGAINPDAGTIRVGGKDAGTLTPARSLELGISTSFQEINLASELSVAENILFGDVPTQRGFTDRRRLRREVEDLTASLLVEVDPDKRVGDLPLAQQQMVEFVRSIRLGGRVLVLDEPTAALSEAEADALFTAIGRAVERDVAVVYISHRLEEVLTISQRVTVLRDGQHVGTLDAATATRAELVRMMVGREINELFPKRKTRIGEPVLEVRGLLPAAAENPIDLTVHAGEIVGVFGLVGSGRTEAARAICGLDPPQAGDVRVKGRPVRVSGVRDALREGIVLIPEDRKTVGLILSQSVKDNICLPNLHQLTRFRLLSNRRERGLAERQVSSLAIRTPSVSQHVVNLSGGNQQKVVIGKWLARELAVLIADEPTRGIDVATKAQVHALISELAATGVGIVLISSELPEILGMSDRVVVFHEGRIAASFPISETTPERVMHCATGGLEGTEGSLAAGVRQ